MAARHATADNGPRPPLYGRRPGDRGAAPCRAGSIWSRRRSGTCATSRCAALEILAAADLVACEDTRVTRKLFDHYGLSAPLIAYHDHNAEAARPKILREARRRRGRRARLRCRHAADLRSGLPLVREAVAAGACGHRGARRLGGADGADRRGTADRPVLLRGLPAREGRRTARAHRRACAHPGNARAVRERAAPCRRRSPISRPGSVPREAAIGARAHQAARRSPARHARHARTRLCGGRGDARRVRRS